MKKILLVGCGNAGSRHLQSLLKLKIDCKICIIEKSNNSIILAKKRCNEVQKNNFKKSIYFFENVSFIQDETNFDFCIIATNSDQRLIVINQVVNKFDIKYMILEKFLFQGLNDYKIASDLLKKYNIKTWVNCLRREIPSWHTIKEIIQNFRSDYYTVKFYNADWSICSNSIHCLDLFSWLFESKIKNLNNSQIKKEVFYSKRKGFIEFYGILYGICYCIFKEGVQG